LQAEFAPPSIRLIDHPSRRSAMTQADPALLSQLPLIIWEAGVHPEARGFIMAGIHHITAIAGNPVRNLDFYTHTLGLRLVKKTVNFDDPGTYHLYYGDDVGHPGTILTFFPWEHAAPGRSGVGLAQQTAFRIPAGSIGYWMHRLIEKSVPHNGIEKRFGESVLSFTDPDGMSLALVGVTHAGDPSTWHDGDIPAEHAIRGFHGVTVLVESAARTGAVLTDVLGFRETAREATSIRYESADAGAGGVVVVHEAGGFLPGRLGRGSVHHIAFRAVDDAQQATMARLLAETHGLSPTEQRDRKYFRSVYFREPGGILFEIATEDPGFTVDEPPAALGHGLQLPAFLESQRSTIAAVLPPLGPLETAA
jgi:glyoxalase family protein